MAIRNIDDVYRSINLTDLSSKYVQLMLNLYALANAVHADIMGDIEDRNRWINHQRDYQYLAEQLRTRQPTSFALKTMIAYTILKARDPTTSFSLHVMTTPYGKMLYLRGRDITYTPGSYDPSNADEDIIIDQSHDIGAYVMRNDLLHSPNFFPSVIALKDYYVNLASILDSALEPGSDIFEIISSIPIIEESTHNSLLSSILATKIQRGINLIMTQYPPQISNMSNIEDIIKAATQDPVLMRDRYVKLALSLIALEQYTYQGDPALTPETNNTLRDQLFNEVQNPSSALQINGMTNQLRAIAAYTILRVSNPSKNYEIVMEENPVLGTYTYLIDETGQKIASPPFPFTQNKDVKVCNADDILRNTYAYQAYSTIIEEDLDSFFTLGPSLSAVVHEATKPGMRFMHILMDSPNTRHMRGRELSQIAQAILIIKLRRGIDIILDHFKPLGC